MNQGRELAASGTSEGIGSAQGSVEVTAGAEVVASVAQGLQTFSREEGEFELKAAREAHKQRIELRKLEGELAEQENRRESDLRELETSRRYRRWLLAIAFGAGLLIVVSGIATGGAMAFFADDQDVRDFGEQLVFLLVGSVSGAWAGFMAGSKLG